MNRAATLLVPLVLLACRASDEVAPALEMPVLEMKQSCERCEAVLAHDAEAYICSYECTFCSECTHSMEAVCPNCGGELKPRPKRGR
jgi:hypothetical protein